MNHRQFSSIKAGNQLNLLGVFIIRGWGDLFRRGLKGSWCLYIRIRGGLGGMRFMVTTVDLEVQGNSQRLIQPQEPSKPPFNFGRLPSTMKVHPHHPPHIKVQQPRRASDSFYNYKPLKVYAGILSPKP